MKEFKVGDKVFDLRYGNGVVTEENGTNCAPLRVLFNNGLTELLARNGKSSYSSKYPILYHGHDLVVTVSEPEYEWQVLSKYHNDEYSLTASWYKTLDDFFSCMGKCNDRVSELFEPSKRLVSK